MATAHIRIGLVGAQIGTSLSPALHEAEAQAQGISHYRYELIDIDTLGRVPADAAAVVREAVADGFTGFNITHPCKQTVMSGIDELTPQAAAMGAVNTVTVTHDRLIGHNTDHSGFLTALRTGLPGVAMSSVVLCGAGGAGSAVAHALVEAGTQRLVIADVDEARARLLAAQVAQSRTVTEGVGVAQILDRLREADGVVNASPIGMEGHPGTPFDTAALRREHWVADIVYRPVRTALLAAAAATGCRTLDGAQMLVAQAADSFALLTGIEPDRTRMRTQLQKLLARRTAIAS